MIYLLNSPTKAGLSEAQKAITAYMIACKLRLAVSKLLPINSISLNKPFNISLKPLINSLSTCTASRSGANSSCKTDTLARKLINSSLAWFKVRIAGSSVLLRFLRLLVIIKLSLAFSKPLFWSGCWAPKRPLMRIARTYYTSNGAIRRTPNIIMPHHKTTKSSRKARSLINSSFFGSFFNASEDHFYSQHYWSILTNRSKINEL